MDGMDDETGCSVRSSHNCSDIISVPRTPEFYTKPSGCGRIEVMLERRYALTVSVAGSGFLLEQ